MGVGPLKDVGARCDELADGVLNAVVCWFADKYNLRANDNSYDGSTLPKAWTWAMAAARSHFDSQLAGKWL